MTGADLTILDLLPLVFADPGEALRRAQHILDGEPGPFEASVAHQVIGLWQRDFGDLATGIEHLRWARGMAARSGDADRESDVLAALANALVHAGKTRQALAASNRAVELGSGLTLARVRYRRGYLWWILGRHQEALDDLHLATPVFEQAGDIIWTARALTLRAVVLLALGSIEHANADFESAEKLWASTEQEHDKADAVEWRGLAAFRSGDIPLALSLLDEAARRYVALGTPNYMLSIRRCEVLMTAGLAREALEEADASTERLERIGGHQTRRAELLLTAARAANAVGDAQTAVARASKAVRLFSSQRRTWWASHARLVLIEALMASGRITGRLVRDAAAEAERLTVLGSPAAVDASLLAGRAALALGWTEDAEVHLSSAARSRLTGPAFARAGGWEARALLAEARGSDRAVLAACRSGLDLLDEHRMTLDASELRARATAQGAKLASLAQRASLRSGGPRQLLVWSERWRATALAVPATGPPADGELLRDVIAFREITSRAEAARSGGAPVPGLERERRRLEREIRERTLHVRGAGTGELGRLDVPLLLERLGADRLIEIVAVDGDVHVLVCGDGRVRRFPGGRLSEAVTEAEYLRAGLRRLAHPGGAVRLPVLQAGARRLEEILLGQAAGHLGSGQVVIVPPGRLHDVPWALLPSLTERVFGVSPSARGWLRARDTAPPAEDRFVLVRGPGLATGGAEVPLLGGRYEGAAVLENGTASVPAVLEAIDGAGLVHIAAHGTFRADSPMFSSLRMDDGPLIVHDFEGLSRSPYRIVLSSCSSGRLAGAGADELLGLSAALLPLGTAGIVASCVQVNDEASVPLMLALHERIRSGDTLAEALCEVRQSLADDPLIRAASWSFAAIGAA